MTSNAEWTGVLLSTVLKEAGVHADADWVVAEGVEEVKGASSIPHGEGYGRLLIMLWHERRAGTSSTGLSTATTGTGLRRHLQREVAAAHQGGG